MRLTLKKYFKQQIQQIIQSEAWTNAKYVYRVNMNVYNMYNSINCGLCLKLGGGGLAPIN